MLIQPLITELNTLKLKGMAAALTHQMHSTELQQLNFEDRLGMLISQEQSERSNFRMAQRLRWAKLPQSACTEDVDTASLRGLEPGQWRQLVDLRWVHEHLNLLITGPTGVGKSYLASALAHNACRADILTRCYRLPRLIDELAHVTVMRKRSAFLRQLSRVELLVIDDFGLTPMPDPIVRDLLEILEDRYDKQATLITSQLPLEQWHDYLGNKTVADAILDRLVHNAHKLNLKGESMRKTKAAKKATAASASSTKSGAKTSS
jgi:DNA replication protein DnaC